MTARHDSPLKTVGSILFLLLALALGLLLASTPAYAEAPANDDFDTPTLITALPYTDTLDTSEATADLDDPACSWPYASVWYAFTPASNMRIEADTFNSAYDTALAVYTGTRTNLTQLACNDTWYSAQSFVTLEVEAGVTYYFMVTGHSWWEPGGDLVFTIQESVPPANDDFDNAEEITTLPFEAPSVNVIAATIATDDPVCDDQPANIWYKYTPTETGWLEADPYGNYYTAIGVYTGIYGDLTEIACRASWTYPESIHFEAHAGTTYYFMVGPPNIGGYFVAFNLRESVLPPANDDFASAEVITTLPYTHTVDTTTATTAADDPNCYDANATVWYSYTPPTGMRVEVAASYSASAASISIWTGTWSDLTQFICQYQSTGDSFPIDLSAGTTYYFMVGSPSPSTGSTLTFSLQGEELPPVAPNDDFDDATVISTLPFTNTVYAGLATRADDDPVCLGFGTTIWYVFSATERLSLQVSATGGTADISLSVYTGERGSLDQLYCREGAPAAPLLFVVTPGVTYYFMVGNLSGDLTFAVEETDLLPPNDDFDYPTVVGALPYLDMLNTVNAGPADDDPDSACFSYDNTVWYAFTPTRNMQVAADVHPTLGVEAYGAALAIYTGERGSLDELACADVYAAPLLLDLTAGTTYYFMVSTAAWYVPGDLAFILQQDEFFLFLPAILKPAQTP